MHRHGSHELHVALDAGLALELPGVLVRGISRQIDDLHLESHLLAIQLLKDEVWAFSVWCTDTGEISEEARRVRAVARTGCADAVVRCATI